MQKKGFTLIEVMMVVLIVSILAMIAYPSYQQYVTRARRSDGQHALLDLAARMERYYSQQNTYVGATLGAGANSDVLAGNQSPEGWYILSIQAQSAGAYTLLATPQGAQATTDTQCVNLSINSIGQKGFSGATGNLQQCW